MVHAPAWLSTRPSKGVAFAIHVVLSLLVFSTLVLMMLVYWFPGDLFFLDGGWQGLKLVAMVDLVLGPALTLLLYKPDKPKLLLDMSLIAVIQISALSYGFYTTHQQRAVAIVFAERGFNTVSAKDILEANEQLHLLDEQPQALPPVKAFTLPLLMTPAPSKDQYGQFLADILNGYPGPSQRTDLYIPLASNLEGIRGNALSEQDLLDQGMLGSVQESMATRSMENGELEFYHFKARYAEGIAIFEPKTSQIVDLLPKPSDDKDSSTVAVTENSDEH